MLENQGNKSNVLSLKLFDKLWKFPLPKLIFLQNYRLRFSRFYWTASNVENGSQHLETWFSSLYPNPDRSKMQLT